MCDFRGNFKDLLCLRDRMCQESRLFPKTEVVWSTIANMHLTFSSFGSHFPSVTDPSSQIDFSSSTFLQSGLWDRFKMNRNLS